MYWQLSSPSSSIIPPFPSHLSPLPASPTILTLPSFPSPSITLPSLPSLPLPSLPLPSHHLSPLTSLSPYLPPSPLPPSPLPSLPPSPLPPSPLPPSPLPPSPLPPSPLPPSPLPPSLPPSLSPSPSLSLSPPLSSLPPLPLPQLQHAQYWLWGVVTQCGHDGRHQCIGNQCRWEERGSGVCAYSPQAKPPPTDVGWGVYGVFYTIMATPPLLFCSTT